MPSCACHATVSVGTLCAFRTVSNGLTPVWFWLKRNCVQFTSAAGPAAEAGSALGLARLQKGDPMSDRKVYDLPPDKGEPLPSDPVDKVTGGAAGTAAAA